MRTLDADSPGGPVDCMDAPARASEGVPGERGRSGGVREWRTPRRAAERRTGALPDVPEPIPGQTEMPLHPFQPTLWSA
jgi:hypothetical protein